MAPEWIKSSLALQYVAGGEYGLLAKQKIMERAQAGLIVAKAETLIWGDSENTNRPIPKAFWQSDNHEDFNQDWENGDFSHWVEETIEVRAFGVSFDFVALSEIVPAHEQAASMRLISVIADPEWISAHDLRELMLTKYSGAKVEHAIVEACQLGQIAGRAARMTCDANDTPRGMSDPSVHAASMEWDIPLWFWRDFVRPDHFQDWSLNRAHGNGRRQKRSLKIELQGVHFHRSGLASIGLEHLSAKTNASHSQTDSVDKEAEGASESKPPLSESDLKKWWDSKSKVRNSLTKDELLALVRSKFPNNHVSRERVRELIGARKRGPKGFGGKLSAK